MVLRPQPVPAPALWEDGEADPRRWTWGRLRREALAMAFFAALFLILLYAFLTPSSLGK
jgi:hypothetical protein